MTTIVHDRPIDLGVEIPVERGVIEGDWSIPLHPKGTVIIVNGVGNSRLGRRNRQVAQYLYEARFATLLLDLLTLEEERENSLTGAFQLDIPLLTERLLSASHWVKETEVGDLPLGCMAAGVTSAAAVAASVREPGLVSVIVSCGGRPDLAGIALHKAWTPTLLIVGSADIGGFELNRWALRRLNGEARIAVVPGASHAFEEPDALEQMCRLSVRWLETHVPTRTPFSVTRPMFSMPWSPSGLEGV